jgi:hypothetical protein
MHKKSLAAVVIGSLLIATTLSGCAVYSTDASGATVILQLPASLEESSKASTMVIAPDDGGMHIIDSSCPANTKLTLISKRAIMLEGVRRESKFENTIDFWRGSVWVFEDESDASALMSNLNSTLADDSCTDPEPDESLNQTIAEYTSVSDVLVSGLEGFVFDERTITGSDVWPNYTTRTYVIRRGTVVSKVFAYQLDGSISPTLRLADEFAQSIADKMSQ